MKRRSLRRAAGRCIRIGTIVCIAGLSAWASSETTPNAANSVVTQVLNGGSAASAGIRAGDRVVAADGRPAPGIRQLVHLDREVAAIRQVTYTLERDGQHRDVTLPVGERGWQLSTLWSPEVTDRLAEIERRVANGGSAEAALNLDSDVPAARRDDLAQEWSRLSQQLLSAGRFVEAAAFTRDWSSRVDETWQGDAHRLLAEAHAGLGETEAARSEFVAAVAATERRSPLQAATHLARWATYETSQAAPEEAWRLAQQVVGIREREAGSSLLTVRTENMLADVHWWSGRLQGHREASQRAVRLAERVAPGTVEHARALTRLGTSDWAWGQIASSRQRLERAVEITAERAPGSLAHADALHQLARPVVILGDLIRARNLTQQGLEIRENLAWGSLDHAWSRNNLGNFELWLGNFRKAREHYLAAWGIRRQRAARKPSEAYSMMNLADLAMQLGDVQAARESIERGLDIVLEVLPDSPDEALCLRTLGEIDLDQGRLEDAKRRLERALEIQTRTVAANGEIVFIRLSLGRVHMELGEVEAAERHFRAVETMHAVLGPTETLASSYLLQAEIARQRGQVDRALELDRKALDVYEHWEGSLVRGKVLHHLGTVERQRGDRERAREHFDAAVGEIDAARRRIGGQWTRLFTSRLVAEMHHSRIGVLIEMGRMSEALAALEAGRARGTVEFMVEQSIDWKDQLPSHLSTRLDEIQARRRYVSEQMLRAGGAPDSIALREWRSELARLNAEDDAVSDLIHAERPELAAIRNPPTLGVAEVEAAIPEGALLIAFSVGADSTHVLRARREPSGELRVAADTIDIGRVELGDRVELLRGLLTASHAERDSADWGTLATRLSHDLLDSAVDDLLQADRITIMPDGPLNLVPWSLLAAGRDGLLDDGRSIHQIPSLATYRRMRGRESERAPLRWIGIGAPELAHLREAMSEAAPGLNGEPKRRSRELFDLPGAREELETIHDMLGGGSTELYVGARASEARARTLGAGATIVHFASHGWIDDRLPLQSALVLSTDDPVRHDGFLQAWEIIDDMRLRSDLVVLSGCDTGVGEIISGEGALGLSQAFLLGGARSVLVSLWPISDESAAVFMRRFYRELLDGYAKDTALQRAQRFMRESTGYSHPYHWAGFSLVGDERQVVALRGVGGSTRTRTVAATLALGVILVLLLAALRTR